MALAWTGDELSRGQAQNGVNFDFAVKFDLEGQGQSPPKTIGILTKVFYIYGPNLVILAETGHELSRGQAHDWHTDGHTHTHRQTQATTIPEGQYWPQVIKSMLKSMLVRQRFSNMANIDQQLCCQPIKWQVWKYLFTNMDLIFVTELNSNSQKHCHRFMWLFDIHLLWYALLSGCIFTTNK